MYIIQKFFCLIWATFIGPFSALKIGGGLFPNLPLSDSKTGRKRQKCFLRDFLLTFMKNVLTLFKKGIRLDFGTCEHGNSLEGMHLILLDHTKLDFKFERAILEKIKFSTFFIE